MRKYLSSIILLLFCGATYAQSLKTARQSSYYTYIYPTTDALVQQLYAGDPLDERQLTKPLDSFLTDKGSLPNLAPGNYLRVHVNKGQLHYYLLEKRSVYVKLLKDRNELQFVLTDKAGHEVKSASVTLNGRPLAFNHQAGIWHHAYPKKELSVLRIHHEGVANYTIIIRDDDPFGLAKRSNKRSSKKDQYTFLPEKPGNFTGYMVFSKPQYKPLDTVKFKAFILKGKGKKPVNQTLRVQLVDRNVVKILGEIKPDYPGAYDYSFALHDSLKLQLDRNYSIKLIDDKHTYQAGSFNFSDYELKSSSFNMRADDKNPVAGKKTALYFQATDQNGLNVLDGRVSMTLVTNYIKAFSEENVFVPDTLWTHNFKLEPVGETKVILPDTIFPKASINYMAYASFLNADNENIKRSVYLSNDLEVAQALKFEARGDSLHIQSVDSTFKDTAPFKIIGLNHDGDTLERRSLPLPALLKINPGVMEYEVLRDTVIGSFELSTINADLFVNSVRTADSLKITVSNPRKLRFWYTVYKGKKIVDRGQAVDLTYAKAFDKKEITAFRYNYIWADEAHAYEVQSSFMEKELRLAVSQPMVISPGEKAAIEVLVTDAKGLPVENVDLTAYSFTSKFRYYSGGVPNMGKLWPQRKSNYPLEWDEGLSQKALPLNWERWGKALGLDSMAYFKFTHPDPVYQTEEQVSDSLAQIAPFIMDKGEIVPIEVLYINSVPVYFSQAQQLQRYAFRVAPGNAFLQFRLGDYLYSVDSVQLRKGVRTVLSFALDGEGAGLRKVSMPRTLTVMEAQTLNKYMLTVEDNFRPNFAQVSTPDQVLLLKPVSNNPYTTGNSMLVGPLSSPFVQYQEKGGKDISFENEPNFSFTFKPGLIKQRSIPSAYSFNPVLSASTAPDYKDEVLTNAAADSIWTDYIDLMSHTTPLFGQGYPGNKGNGQLQIKYEAVASGVKLPLVKSLFIYRYDQPDYLKIYAGRETSLGYFEPGLYRMLALLKGDRYVLMDSVRIMTHGTTLRQISLAQPRKKDDLSAKLSSWITAKASGSLDDPNADQTGLMESFNSQYADVLSYTKTMSGYVFDKSTGLTVAGALVKVKGTHLQVTTDNKGRFSIKVPEKGTLQVIFLGYSTREVPVKHTGGNNIYLAENDNALSEVVVVGYGDKKVVHINELLQGKVAGVSTPGIRGTTHIRGISQAKVTVDNGPGPLVIIDGVISTKTADMLDPATIAEISVLKPDAARAIYGARGAQGVVLVTTKKGLLAAAGNTDAEGVSMRKNFSDAAFWQPKLRTDAAGKAKFHVTFPDDITSWRTFYLAMNGNKQSGYAESQIKSFRAISAALVSPAFAIEGDVFNPIGKIANYTSDTVGLERTFKYNGELVLRSQISVKNSHLDTFKVVAKGRDSLKFEYSLRKTQGYSDGEQRTIPLFNAGVLETKGVFKAMNVDTALTLLTDEKLGKVHLRAEASMLPVLLEETERLRRYEYLCNEQLASKLKGLLVQKRIYTFHKLPFKHDQLVRQLIKKLVEGRNDNSGWGWWKNSSDELWISNHAVSALLDAEQSGYANPMNKEQMISYLLHRLPAYYGREKLEALLLLHRMKAKVEYQMPIADYELDLKKAKHAGLVYDKFRLLHLKQQLGLPINTDSVMKYKRSTMFGNLYFGEHNRQLFDNSIQNSILAYKVLKAEGKHPERLMKIRNFLLEQRQQGYWRNTYESALILETLVQDLVNEDGVVKPVMMNLTAGTRTELVKAFPFTAEFDAGTRIELKKQGTVPVYVTAYQQFWNAQPEKLSKDFNVNTWFESKAGSKLSLLKGGEAVLMKVEVTARADGDYVMIEIPIPAGCSYDEKMQSWAGFEVHREYFKNKVSIFCRKLKKGTHTFSVKLMPRYDGNYTLNPAKAELMYFPVFNGREGMKKVAIGQ